MKKELWIIQRIKNALQNLLHHGQIEHLWLIVKSRKEKKKERKKKKKKKKRIYLLGALFRETND